MYFDCQSPGPDRNFLNMVETLSYISSSKDKLSAAVREIEINYCARRIHLLLLLQNFPLLTPRNHLEIQLFGNKQPVKNIVSILHTLPIEYDLSKLLDYVNNRIREMSPEYASVEIVAIDEARAASLQLKRHISVESKTIFPQASESKFKFTGMLAGFYTYFAKRPVTSNYMTFSNLYIC